MNLVKLYGNMIIVALLVFALLSFVFIVQSDNDASEKLIDNELMNDTYNELYGNLSDSQEQSQTSSDVFGNVTPNENLGVWEVTPIVAPTRTLKAVTLGAYNIVVKLPMKVLGVSPIVAGVISGIFLLLLIIGVWAIWKGVIQQ